MKRFSDFSKEEILDGDKIKLDDILNQEINIIGYSIKSSKLKDGKYLTLQIEFKGKKHVIFTGSEVLINQTEKYKNEMPFLATIRKINKYYSFT
jgi:hypothetical protein